VVSMENKDLLEAVKMEMERRVQVLVQGDPEFQRLRGMLDVLEGKVKVSQPDDQSQTEVEEQAS
jgi:hypothetical protein